MIGVCVGRAFEGSEYTGCDCEQHHIHAISPRLLVFTARRMVVVAPPEVSDGENEIKAHDQDVSWKTG